MTQVEEALLKTLNREIDRRLESTTQNLCAVCPQAAWSDSAYWQRFERQRITWSERHLNRWLRQNRHRDSVDVAALETADLGELATRIVRGLEQSGIVDVLQTDGLTGEFVTELKARVWGNVESQVIRIATGFRRSAEKRGFDEADLLQEAYAHFDSVLTRFDPFHPRCALFETWWDDVVTNLFVAMVRPRKSDVLHRGRGTSAASSSTTESDGILEQWDESGEAQLRQQRRAQQVRESLAEIEEICDRLIKEGVVPWERVFAFQMYTVEGMTYKQIAEALTRQGKKFGTTQMFNFVKEVRAEIVQRFQGDPLSNS